MHGTEECCAPPPSPSKIVMFYLHFDISALPLTQRSEACACAYVVFFSHYC